MHLNGNQNCYIQSFCFFEMENINFNDELRDELFSNEIVVGFSKTHIHKEMVNFKFL